MRREGKVYIKDKLAGIVWEDQDGFGFQYDKTYLENPIYGEVSKTLPLKDSAYIDKNMLPFFDGLIPEGWLLNIATKNWKLNQRDRMGLLLSVCKDCIGAISIEKIEDGN
jgi:serine/threonine-protein kinase HipA